MIIVPIKDILLGQHDDGEFVRYDLVIKYMFLKKYYKKGKSKKFEFKPYDNLFLYKGTSLTHIRKAYRQYFKLIESFEKLGFLDDYPLCMNDKFHMHGGSHRLVLAIWHNMENVPTKFDNEHRSRRKSKRHYTKKWIIKNSMKKKLKKIQYTKKEVFEKIGLKC